MPMADAEALSQEPLCRRKMRCELVPAVGAQAKLGPFPRKRPLAPGKDGRRGRIGVDERARQLLPVDSASASGG